jgi:hypothetical protein
MKSSLILILLLSILNNAEFKQNLLAKISDVEEPVLRANLSALRKEASQAVKNLFGISYSFDLTVFEKEVVIYYGNPKITAKLSSSCSTSITMGSNSGSFTLKGGAVISQKGTTVNLNQSSLNLVGKNLNLDFSTMTATLTKKLKTATTDGTVSFSFSPTEAKIEITFTPKGQTTCDGKLTLTISAGVNPSPSPQPAFNKEAIQTATKTVATGGAIAVGAVLLFKLVKGVAGFAVGGPVGGLIGVLA